MGHAGRDERARSRAHDVTVRRAGRDGSAVRAGRPRGPVARAGDGLAGDARSPAGSAQRRQLERGAIPDTRRRHRQRAAVTMLPSRLIGKLAIVIPFAYY